MRLTRPSPSRSKGAGEGGRTPAALLPFLLVAAALTLRLPLISPFPLGWDAVDFALALERYDLAAMQPHFPGYPLFVWAGRLAHGLIGNPFLALGAVSALAGGLAVGLLHRLGEEMGDRFTGLMAAVWLALSPLAWLVSEQAMSDSLGFLGSLAFLLAAWRYHRAGGAGRAAMAALLLGATLGVRLSYFPLGLTLLGLVLLRRRWQDLLAAAGAGLAGVLPWLLWQIAQEGPARFLLLATRFTGGHLSDWGGAVGAAHAATAREYLFFWRNWLGLGLGGPGAGSPAGWLLLLLLAAGLALGWRHLDRRFLLLWLLPYLAWAFWGQNPLNPRHLLPVLPWAVLVASRGWSTLPGRWRTAGLLSLAAVLAIASAPLVLEHAKAPPPAVQLARHLEGERQAPVFTWEEERVIRYYSPDVTVYRLRRLPHFEQVLLALPEPPERVLATSAFLNGLGPEGERVRRHFRPVARFHGHPLIHTTYSEIVLYEAGPALYRALAEGR